MPILPSSYRKPWVFFSNHIETIYPVLFRDVKEVLYTRERLELPDGDFVDLDWIKKSGKQLVVLSHGLEGNSESFYLKGMARACSDEGYDVVAWNYRGCSGEVNRLFRFYHSGESNDLRLVLNHILSVTNYRSISLIGFSVGASITLKYLGEEGSSISPLIKSAVTFSSPCNLKSGALHLANFSNRIYMKRFLSSLHKKIQRKAEQFPELINDQNYASIKNFIYFDERYTAPIHGFSSADHYYAENSAEKFISAIAIPTLLVSALNDPFLPDACYPIKQANNNPTFFLEIPKTGGHCGFYESNANGNYWSDNRALSFMKQMH